MKLKIKPNKKIQKNEILDFEKNNNIILHNSYKNFLLEFNGGSVQRNKFDFITYSGKPYYFELTYLMKLSEIKILQSEYWSDYLSIGYAHGGIGFESRICFPIIENECLEQVYLFEVGDGELDLVASNFLEFVNNFTSRFDNKFEKLCDANDIEGLIKLINDGFDLNTTNRYGFKLSGTAYHYYSYKDKNFLEIIKLLANLSKKNNLDIRPHFHGELFEVLEVALTDNSWFIRLSEYEKKMYKEIYEILKNKGKN